MKTHLLLPIILFFCCFSCLSPDASEKQTNRPVQVVLETTLGSIILQLSDSTPLHRDNFLKLVEEQAYDSLLFHRVIDEFMIQAGDPDSKYAASEVALGNGDKDYKVPAEFHPDLFHRRGALGAARDGNKARASSAMQFYIVQRGPRPDSLINKDEKRINGWLAEYFVKQDTTHAFLLDAIDLAQETKDVDLYKWATDSIVALAADANVPWYSIPEEHRAIYKTEGGTPHLDQNYTVFGHVIQGMEVVDAIAAVETNNANRPIKDVRILRAEVLRD